MILPSNHCNRHGLGLLQGLAIVSLFLCASGRGQNGALSTKAQLSETPKPYGAEGFDPKPALVAEDTSPLLNAEEIEEEYARARFAIKTHDWAQALVALEMISASHPDYRNVNELTAAARLGLEQDTTETRLARFYVDGIKAKRAGDLNRARQALLAVDELAPDFRDTAQLLAEIERELQPQSSAPALEIVIEVPIDSLYPAVEAALARKDWKAAVAIFNELETLDPENHELRKQADQARANLLIEQFGLARVEARSNSPHLLKCVTIISAMLSLPLFMGIALSSRCRARYYLMRGNHRRAEQVYENLLLRAPARVKIYPALAALYLRSGRTDATAMKTFKTILHLNLPTPNRGRIDALVSQNAMTYHEHNLAALQVLEAVWEEGRRRNALVPCRSTKL